VPDVIALQNSVDILRQLGFLKAEIDVQKYLELGYVKEAASRLK
jgi:hypothetical protein